MLESVKKFNEVVADLDKKAGESALERFKREFVGEHEATGITYLNYLEAQIERLARYELYYNKIQARAKLQYHKNKEELELLRSQRIK